MMSAIRVARAFTGPPLILKFAGNYHGHFDLALLDAGASAHTTDAARSGIPEASRATLRWRATTISTRSTRCCAGGKRAGGDLVEPIVGNMGYVTPVRGFLEGLRERTQRAARCWSSTR